MTRLVPMCFLAVIVALLTCVHCNAAEPVKTERVPTERARNHIDSSAIQLHTDTLADDAFEGREAGRQGGRAAATYIVRALKLQGLSPKGERGSYYQDFGRGYRNILAVIPGTDPELRDQFLILSAHYDHVGRGNQTNSNGGIGSIHNGADDNASGVAAVLEIARVLANHLDRGRSILVVFWDAEEKGLLGSKHWIRQPTVDLELIRYVVNVDMVGRLRDRLLLYGTRTMPGLRMQWSLANEATGIAIDFPWEVINNSDHYTFFQRRVPVTMVHTGLHDDYHRYSDDAHRLNKEGIVRVSQLVVAAILRAANQPKLGPFRETSLTERDAAQRYFERPFQQQQRRLGITVRPYRGEFGNGLRIATVWAGSPASQAGLKPGNLILDADGQHVTSVAELRERINAAGRILTLQMVDEGATRTVEVTLAGQPQRIGLSWRTSDAEPNVVVLSGIVAGSPAAKAGCRSLDRVVEVNGESILGSDDFRERMENSSGLTELFLERDGKFMTVVLDAPEAATSSSSPDQTTRRLR